MTNTADRMKRDPAILRNRDASTDVLKGMGILIIAMGHIDSGGIGAAFVSYLYTFNVALFFVVSGSMYRENAGERLLDGVLKKFHQVLVPYLVLFTVSLLYGHVVVRYVFGQYVIPFEWGATLKALLFSSEWLNSVPTFNFALWFLPIFFLASAAFLILQKIRQPVVYSGVVLALVLVSLPLQALIPGRPILTINVLPVAIALMGCGHLITRYQIAERLPQSALAALLTLTLIVAFFVPGNIGNIGTYWYFPSALASVLLLKYLAQRLRNNRFLAYIGRHSLSVFGIHGLVANTYSYTHIPSLLETGWDGLMLYIANLAYVIIVSVLIVAAYSGVHRKITSWVERRHHHAQQASF